MRQRAVIIAWTVGAWLLMATAARGGEYHYGATLICSDCHTMHYSQQHDYSGGPAPPLGGGGPFKFLLRSQDSDVCLTCHDGQTFAPDVYGANTGTYVRQAGAITTGSNPFENWKGHTLNITATPPGGTMNIKLQCYNCHDKHGNSNFRNLNGVITPITYAKGTNDTTKDVFLRSWVLGQISTNYSVGNVDFNEPNTNQSAYGRFCKGCHTDFHGQKGDSNMGGSSGVEWLRHPTAGANIGAVGGEHSSLDTFKNRLYRVQVMSPSGNWGTQGQAWGAAPNDLTPSCMSCHKAHGNQNPFGLIYLKGTGTITEEGDADGNAAASSGGGARNLCKQCHVQGG